MGFFLGIIKLFLILGCFKLANETDDWKVPAALFSVANAMLFFIDGEFQLKDFLQFFIVTAFAFGIFFLL